MSTKKTAVLISTVTFTGLLITNLATLLLNSVIGALGVIAATVVVAVIMSFLSYRISIKGMRAAKLIREVLFAFSEGDFKKEINFGNAKDPILKSAKEDMEKLADKINSIMGDIKNNYDGVVVKRESILSKFEDMNEIIEELNGNAIKQEDVYKSIVSNFEGVTGGIQEIASAANIAASTSSKTLELTSSTVDLANTGMTNVQESLIKMGEIKANTDITAESVARLEKLANEIGGIIGSITKISEQTNLLALNAAIEAARAGEAGKGFAVVAQEIRGLADESRKAAGNINSIVNIIQEETKQAVEKMNKTSLVVTEGSEISTSVGGSLNAMLDSISMINSMMGDVAAGAQEQSSNTHEIAGRMDKITGLVSEDVIRRKENAANITKETALIENMKDELNELNGAFGVLTQKLGAFKLKERASRKGVTPRK